MSRKEWIAIQLSDFPDPSVERVEALRKLFLTGSVENELVREVS